MTNGSFHLGTYAGIPLKLHWTFSLTFLLVLIIGLVNKDTFLEISIIFGFIIVMFFCVVLHEYGHALMARRFKVKTIDIILSPIGGLARLERLPSKPIQEFYIAIAGPSVNALLAGLIAIILFAASKPIIIDMGIPVSEANSWEGYLSLVLILNLGLFVFNLIPAFPMDGGRILRSLLSIKIGKMRSTIIAAYIGYFFAAAFIIYSFISHNYILSAIGLFVIIMARGELSSAKHEHFLQHNDVNLTGLKNEHLFTSTSKMYEVISIYHDDKDKYFLVQKEDGSYGAITEKTIKKVIKAQQFNDDILDHIEELALGITVERTLQQALTIMEQNKSPYLVFHGEERPYLVEKVKIFRFMHGRRS